MKRVADVASCVGKRALISGGGTGIGRAIALALAQRGAAIALVGRRAAPLTAVAHEIDRLGGQAIVLPADITDPIARVALIEQMHEQLGPIDILINSAALLSNGALCDVAPETVDTTIATNLTAPIALTQLCLPDLLAQRGKVALIGSTTSFVPLPYLALYSATKAALHSFGSSLRYELKPQGVHIYIAYPPTTTTPMTAAMRARVQQKPWRGAFNVAMPEQVGEKIVRDLLLGKEESIWWSGEHLLRCVYHAMPRLTRYLLYTQRRRLAEILCATEWWSGGPMTGGDHRGNA